MNPVQPRVGPGGLLLLLPWAWLVHRYWFLCDDAFITFRYSRNWAEGHGPIYNLGEVPPVEGYSDFLWMALAALVHKLGGDMPSVMPWVSAACAAVLLLLVHRALRTLGRVDGPTAIGATAILALFPSFAVWSTSGLETMPQALAHFAAWYLLVSRRSAAWVPIAAGLAGLSLALLRTEGVAWCVVIAILAGLQRWAEGRPFLRDVGAFLALVVAGYTAYFSWRYPFYQSLLANTAYAKVHATPATLVRGLTYVALFVATTVSPVLLLAGSVAGLRGDTRWVVAGAGTMGLGVLAYAAAVSGDYMAWFRILVPALPFLVLAFGASLPSLGLRGVRAAGLAAVVAAVGLLPAADVHLMPERVRSQLNVREKLDRFRSENQQWAAMAEHVRSWTLRGQALASYGPPSTSLVAGAIGCLGYYSNFTIYDRNGLVTAEVARAPWDGQLRSPGHDKTVEPDFFLPWKPDLLDAKLVEGKKLGARVESTLEEMNAERYREQYHPVLAPANLPGRRQRVLLVLARSSDASASERGWARFYEDLGELESR